MEIKSTPLTSCTETGNVPENNVPTKAAFYTTKISIKNNIAKT